MNITEAITKAGPGGTITGGRCKAILEISDGGVLLNHKGTQTGWTPRADSLTATDWEVIPEERIEVGDTVAYGESDLEHVVTWCRDGMVQTQYADDAHRPPCNISNLTLIHKGKRHVFEGVQWKDIPCPQDAFGATSACVPHSKTPAQGLVDLCDNGKTYRMELIEEADVS